MGFKAKLPILIVLFSLFVSSALSLRPIADDPRTEIRHCRQRCQQKGHGFHQIRECMERCESMSPDDDDEAVIVLVDRELDQCQRRCQRHKSGRRCFERCEDRFGDRQQGSRCEDERDVPFLRRDPEQQRYQQCRMRCERKESGRQQRQCQKDCKEQFQQQAEGGCRRRESRYDSDSDEVNIDRHDPQQRYQRCQMRCEREESGHQQRQCQKDCKEQFEQESDIGFDSDEANIDRHDPEKRFHQCQMRCERKGSGHQQRQCRKDCKEQFEQEKERSSDDDEAIIDRRDPEQVFRQCRRQCSGGRCEQRCEDQMQCHQSCQSKFPYRGQEGKLGHCVQSCYEDDQGHGGEEGRGFMETMCRIQGGGYECQRRCQRQYGGNAALASLLSIFA